MGVRSSSSNIIRVTTKDTFGRYALRTVAGVEANPFTDFDLAVKVFTFNLPIDTLISDFIPVDGNPPVTYELLEQDADYFKIENNQLIKNVEIVPLGFSSIKVRATDTVGFTVVKDIELEAVESSFINQFSTSFDGVDETADIGNVNIPNNLSIFCWIKTTKTATANLLTKFNAGNFVYRLQCSTGKLRVFIYEDGTSTFRKDYIAPQIINDGNWHFIGFTFVNDELKLYIDGVYANNPTKLADEEVLTLFPSNQEVIIGAQYNGANKFEGNMDELAIWGDQVLSDTQVLELYNNGEPIDLSGHSSAAYLKHWYRMGDNMTPTQIPDAIGDNPAQLINMDLDNKSTDVPE